MLAVDFFFHYLFSKRAGSVIRAISWICVLGIGVGVAALVIVLSVMNGFNGTIRDRMLLVKPHLVVSHKKSESENVKKLVEPFGGGSKLFPFETQDFIIRTLDGYFSGGVGLGYSEEDFKHYLKRVHELSKKRQSSLPDLDLETDRLGPREVYIGADLAHKLRLFEGDQAIIVPPESLLLPKGEVPPYERVTIKGIILTEMPEIDGKLIFYNKDGGLPRLAFSKSKQYGTEIRLQDPNEFSEIKAILESKEISIETWQEADRPLFFALMLEKIVMSVFFLIACLIPSFSIMTVIILLITQKKKDIGLLMAMGLAAEETKKIFVKISFMLSLLGMGGGFLVGIVVSLLIHYYPVEVLPDIYYDATIPAELDYPVLGFILIGLSFLAWFAATLPAKLSGQMTASEALR